MLVRTTALFTALIGTGCSWASLRPPEGPMGPVPPRAAPSPIVAGSDHTCVLRPEGTVVCWGANTSGQLGDGTRIPRYRAAEVVGLKGVTMVKADGRTTCSLDSHGMVHCLGDLRIERVRRDYPEPHYIAALSPAVDISVGASHICALDTNGQVRCMGELADYATEYGDDEWKVRTIRHLDDAIEIASGSHHACARRATGGVSCWGANDNGQLGFGGGTEIVDDYAVRVPLRGVISAVRADGNTTFARFLDGSYAFWGSHRATGKAMTEPTRLVIPRGTVDVIAGDCFLIADGSVTCPQMFGRNPVTIRSSARVERLAIGGQHACMVTSDARVRCMGDNSYGQLGIGTAKNASGFPNDVPGIHDAAEVVMSESHACARRVSGEVICWQQANTGAILLETVKNLGRVRSLAVGFEAFWATTDDGKTKCWYQPPPIVAYSSAVNLDERSHTIVLEEYRCQSETNVAREAPGFGNVAGAVATAGYCVLMNDGTVRCYHDGAKKYSEVKGLNNPQPFHGVDWSCVVDATGHVWCLEKTDSGYHMKEIPGLTNVKSVEQGTGMKYALHNDGRVSCNVSWDEQSGSFRYAIVQGIDDAVEIACGFFFACARRANGHVSCWGIGEYGVLGDGNGGDHHEAEPVIGIDDAVELDISHTSACVRRASGRVACWGSIMSGVAQVARPDKPVYGLRL